MPYDLHGASNYRTAFLKDEDFERLIDHLIGAGQALSSSFDLALGCCLSNRALQTYHDVLEAWLLQENLKSQ